MESKLFHLLLCFLLFFHLNPFIYFSRATSSHHSDKHNSSNLSLNFLIPLNGTRKGNMATGFSQLKKYLTNLGYLDNDNANHLSHETDNLFDDNLELAIQKYQQFFNLKVNGILDDDTIAKMQEPRCGCPDFVHDHNRTGLFLNTSSSKYAFFPGELKWPPTKRQLTYSFPSGTRRDLKFVFLKVTRIWSNVSPFKFTYTSNYAKADIKISLQRRDHGDGSPFDGPNGILAHAFAPIDGRLHMDGDETWYDGVKPGAYDLFTVGLHEMSHILGLGHSRDETSIMYPYIGSGSRKRLGQDDINGIKALYKF